MHYKKRVHGYVYEKAAVQTEFLRISIYEDIT